MTVDSVLAVLRWALPIALFALKPLGERLALWRGRDGLGAYVPHDGWLVHRAYLSIAAERGKPLASRIARQIGRDLTSPTSLAFISIIVLTIVIGVRSGGWIGSTIGVVFGGFYIYMFVSTLRGHAAFDITRVFDAELLTLADPNFTGHALASIRAADGRTMQANVAWRPVEALSRAKVPFKLVLADTVPMPTFVGLKKL